VVMAQLSLLEPEPALPEGFVYQPHLISIDEELELASRISELDLREFEFQGYRGKRRVASFGLRYDFADSRLKQGDEIPAFLLPLRERAAGFAGIKPDALPHVLVTEYTPGAAIGWHRDRPVFGDVVGVSLCSACRFRFRRKAGTKWERASLILEPRSAYLLRGPSRTEWEHSIPEAEELRYSVTFRTLKSTSDRLREP
jgi:alkylated DNA repair dioxygenase AlkB